MLELWANIEQDLSKLAPDIGVDGAMSDQEAALAITQIDLAIQKLGKHAATGRMKARETRLKESDAEVWKAIAKPRAPAT
eukprot:3691427-Heterocapsa_arctica.AAC.1